MPGLMLKVLITDDVHPLLIMSLQERGFVVDFLPDITTSETIAIIECYSGLIINSKIFCGEELLSRAHLLQWIVRLGSGMEVIDTELCDRLGIQYANTPEGNCNAVAEHTLGLLLSLMRNIVKAHQEVTAMQWIREANRGEELAGKTVAILGYGHTGSAFARLLAPFQVKVLAYDKYKKGFGCNLPQVDETKKNKTYSSLDEHHTIAENQLCKQEVKNTYIFESELETIFYEADILSLHLPLTVETEHWIDESFLSSFKKDIILLNTSRGKIVKTDAALMLLQSGKIKGMALDVLENEKLDSLNPFEHNTFSKLRESNKIILTPHIAGWTQESKEKIAKYTLKKIDFFLLSSR